MGFLAACAIAALVVLAIVYRLVFAHRIRVPGARTRQPRLGLVDAFSLDGQRQLVLIRRDNVEHLVMIGGPNDVLVESQISRAVAPVRDANLTQPAPAAQPRRRAEPVVAPAPPAAGSAVEPPAAPRSPAVSTADAARTDSAPAPAPSAAPAAGMSAPLVPPLPPTRTVAVQQAPTAKAVGKDLEPSRPTGSPRLQPLPPRPAMPPPIAAGPASRSNLTRPTEKAPAAAPLSQPAPPAAHVAQLPATPNASSPSPKPELRVPPPTAVKPPDEAQNPAKVEGKPETRHQAATAASSGDSQAGAAPLAPRADRTAPMEATNRSPVSSSPVPSPQALGSPTPSPQAPTPAPSSRAPDSQAAGDDHSPPQKTANVDPLVDVDSLEAEMARLLGREK